MASKTKKRRLNESKKQNKNGFVVLIALVTGILALLQNKYGQFSDVRGFYGMHFSDGLHHWPFSFHALTGSKEMMHPVEYPALTGLIMWVITFFISPSNTAIINYYQVTAVFHIALFSLTAYLISKIAKREYAIYFAISPAVLYSLNRNWDIWAVMTLIWSIYLFEKQKYRLSAWLLGISIATKFFPIVLLLPIAIQFIRSRKSKILIEYLSITIFTWVIVNIPFILVNFKGWSYFYEFSFNRPLGSASIFELADIHGINYLKSNWIYYLLNIIVMFSLFAYLWISKNIISLKLGSFLTMFSFMLFNKQYSMQYVIWLTALAVLAISQIANSKRFRIHLIFILWQMSEIIFQYSFFQHILTNTFVNSDTPANPAISENLYANVGIIRYLLIILFASCLILDNRIKLNNGDRNSDLIARNK